MRRSLSDRDFTLDLEDRGKFLAPKVAHVVIEDVRPQVDGGRFPVKRIEGDWLDVSADIFRDGHDLVAAALWIRQPGSDSWQSARMRPLSNDQWSCRVRLPSIGQVEYVVEAWTDYFASWCDEIAKKRAAGQPIGVELQEGRNLVEAALGRCVGDSALVRSLRECLEEDARLGPDEDLRLGHLLSKEVANAMDRAIDKSDRVISSVFRAVVDRPVARFSAWYEIFPRSQGKDARHSATFDDCIRRLPEIREMGFDVLYLTPIHPIGEINRKGRANRLGASAGDPGSPYAIGSRFGGHTAIEPSLGTLEDFRRFFRAAGENGLELALDFAVQCAPDHPWLREHPEWFKHRPDGSIKFAENPPKKYEDIVNVDFDQADWRGLWEALRDAMLFWVAEGVRIFRVDNPHTKPFAFWEWLIAEVRRDHPDVIFLAEAFTRPKLMRRIAKLGFSQSYTYFTWRNTKAELTDYLTELTSSGSADILRPIFFPSTPDILPYFLQGSGRPGFRIRLALAATLSPSYGVYNGYELLEATPIPGREEYSDSEKYEFKIRDLQAPGSIRDDIIRLNSLRRSSRALQSFTNLRFHEASHPSVLFYSKAGPDGTKPIFVAASLDPHNSVRTEIVFPLGEMGFAPGGRFSTEELFSEWRQEWAGSRHVIDLDPRAQPVLIWSVL